MCQTYSTAQALMQTASSGCGCCQYMPEITVLQQMWPGYDGADPNPYLYRRGQRTRLIYRIGFVNNQPVVYGSPYSR